MMQRAFRCQKETVDGCLASDSVLLGAVGGAVGHSKWDAMPPHLRPEKALLGIREALGLFTNLRPAKLYPALKGDCPLREDIVAKGFDIMMVRELTGGIYFGERGRRTGKYGEEAYDTECYSRMEIERIAKVAFETAQKRNKMSSPSTRQTYWKAPVCGEKWYTKLQRIIRM